MKTSISILFIALFTLSAAHAVEEDFAKKTINIGMIVSDLEKSMEFYKDVVGFVQVDRTDFDVDGEFGKKSGLTDSLGVHVEILKLGKGEDATELKLMTFGDKPKKQENEYIHSHTGIQYMTIFVTELKPILKRIKEHKVKLLGETPIPLGEKNSFVLIKDPDGTFVELIGPMEKD
ncbi:MAG: VOC family protein [Candidatus Omnitrophica bacterium]|nr:VOC family protein [Candidatus Omnitrophota bacterium]MCA9416191.1 VOC family protein [Candidatus Omnitrophota bacterium]MCA9430788.1 VOC family protein [Candidatus Omnitrophota bacterium]MCA9444167.1 VOC family protein [Candidatus Omnitrophota bacterium]MCB9782186.1 VOC family protein [Candidatus Omnitrophota bacterium]